MQGTDDGVGIGGVRNGENGRCDGRWTTNLHGRLRIICPLSFYLRGRSSIAFRTFRSRVANVVVSGETARIAPVGCWNRAKKEVRYGAGWSFG